MSIEEKGVFLLLERSFPTFASNGIGWPLSLMVSISGIRGIVRGEGSGGVILPASHIGRDARVGLRLTLQHLAAFGGTLSELKRSLPQYSITKGRIGLGILNPDEIPKKLRTNSARREK